MGRYRARHEALFRQWEMCGQPKIALKVKDEQDMVRAALTHPCIGLGVSSVICRGQLHGEPSG